MTDGTFILTTGRSGSTFLARMLGRHPELVVVSDLIEPAVEDPYFDSDRMLDGAAFWRLLVRPALRERVDFWREQPTAELLYLPEDDADVSLLMAYTLPFLSDDPWALRDALGEAVSARPVGLGPDHFRFVLEFLRDRFGGATWVERTGGSLAHAASMVAAWPAARFVVLERDPVETALSMRTGSFFRLCLALDDGRPSEWLAPRYADAAGLAGMIERWTVRSERAVSTLPPERLRRITYERIVEEPVDALAEVGGFVLDREPSATDLAWARESALDVVAPAARSGELSDPDLVCVREACPRSLAGWRERRDAGR